MLVFDDQPKQADDAIAKFVEQVNQMKRTSKN